MKKYDLLKVLGITFLIVMLLSWVIPVGVYSNGTFQSLSTAPIGIFDLFKIPAITAITFIHYGLILLAIGAFYGVLNKTGVYSKIVENIVSKNNKSKSRFLIITVIIFSLLTSVIGNPMLMFVLVPFFVAVILKLGYKKITALASTVGSILVGQIGTTFGFSIWGYLKNVFALEMTTLIFVRIVLLIIVVTLFILLIRKNDREVSITKRKKNKKEEIIEIPLYSELSSKKSILPLVVIGILSFIILALGLYNWYYAFETEFFINLYTSIVSFKIADYPIFANLLGSVSQFGFFSNYDLLAILIISSLIIGWIYNLKLSDIIDGIKDGAKEMIKPAIYSVLASTILMSFINVMEIYNGDFIFTIVNKFVSGSEQFSLLGTVGSTLVSSFAYNDFLTMLSNLYGVFGLYDTNIVPIIAFIFQSIYSLVMVIAPTSVILLAGLSYLDIQYKEWVKYIWKFLLIVFGIIVVIAFILTTLI